MGDKDDEELSSEDEAFAHGALVAIGFGAIGLLVISLEIFIPVEYVIAAITLVGLSLILIRHPRKITTENSTSK